MTLIEKLMERGTDSAKVQRAINNLNAVLNSSIVNAASNTSGAQNMRGNVSTLVEDIEALEKIKEQFDKYEKEAVAEKEKKAKAALAAKAKKDEEDLAAANAVSPVKEEMKKPRADKAEVTNTSVANEA